MTAKRLDGDTKIHAAHMVEQIRQLGKPIDGVDPADVAKKFDCLVAYTLFKKDQTEALEDTRTLMDRIERRDELDAVALHFHRLQQYWLLMPVDEVLAEALVMLAPSDVEQQLRNKLVSNPSQWVMAAVDNRAKSGHDPVPDEYRHLILMKVTEVWPCRIDVKLLPDGAVEFGSLVEVDRLNRGNIGLKVPAFAAKAEG